MADSTETRDRQTIRDFDQSTPRDIPMPLADRRNLDHTADSGRIEMTVYRDWASI